MLGDLAARGLITLQRGRILVRDPAGLADLADSGELAVNTGGHHTNRRPS